MALTVGSLFSGIGGLELGLERAGMQVKWQVEIDDYCNKVLATHWPDVVRFRDVREVGAHNLDPVDLICGGFPCQDVSLAGKRLGLEGERTTLWSEFARLIREIRPRWVLAENVPGLLSSDSGRFFGQVLGDLAASGYDAEWDCIPAAAVGAPHRRDRVFIVAYPAGIGMGKPPEWKRGEVSRGGGAHRGRISTARRIFVTEPTGRWAAEDDSGVCRVANGVPSRVDRLRCLGNAVVPQVAEYIGRLIVAADKEAS